MEIEPVNPDYIPPPEPAVRPEPPEPLPPVSVPPEDETIDEDVVRDDEIGDNVDLMA